MHTNYSYVVWGEEEKSAYVSEKFKSRVSPKIEGEVHPNILLPEVPPFLPFVILHGLSKDVIKPRSYLPGTNTGYMLENKVVGELEQLFASYYYLDPSGFITGLLRYTLNYSIIKYINWYIWVFS